MPNKPSLRDVAKHANVSIGTVSNVLNRPTQVSEEIMEVIFNPNVANIKVESDASKGLVENSAVNFYEGVTTKEAFDFYASKEVAGDRAPLSYGINANLRKENGFLVE